MWFDRLGSELGELLTDDHGGSASVWVSARSGAAKQSTQRVPVGADPVNVAPRRSPDRGANPPRIADEPDRTESLRMTKERARTREGADRARADGGVGRGRKKGTRGSAVAEG